MDKQNTQMSLKDAVKHLVKNMHFVIIPISPKNKGPLLTNWQKLDLDNSYTVMKDWLQRFNNNLNIGIVCGKKSGVFVLDIDVKDDGLKTWETLIKDNGEPNTLYQTTPSGGRHYFFKYHKKYDDLVGTTKLRGVGIDIRTNGNQVVCEPSSYTNGKYKMHGMIIADMPEWLYKWIIESYTKKQEKEQKKDDDKKNNADNDKISQFLNSFFKCDKSIVWTKSKGDNSSYKLTHNNKFCLVKPGVDHSDLNHSCLFINKTSSFTSCFSHKQHKLNKTENEKMNKLRSLLNILDAEDEDTDKNDFEILIDFILKDSKENLYKKENGYILKQVDNIPTHYVKYLEYDKYLHKLFSKRGTVGYKLFRKKAVTFDNLMKYLSQHNDNELPFLERDYNIFSFRNGYVNIKTMVFTVYDKPIYDFASSVFIDSVFDNSMLELKYNDIKTPLFDKLIKYHIDSDMIYLIFLAFIGRLFFNVGELDNWQCMLFIKGQANTGKSTVMNIVKKLFCDSEIGTITANFEGVFGLQNIYNKRLVVVPDMPQNIDQILDRSVLQSLITGESVSVAIKRKEAIQQKWTVPGFWIGNYNLPYLDKAGAIARRIATFTMNKQVKNKKTDLEQKIIQHELQYILIKCVKSYYHHLEKFKNIAFEDWGRKFNISYFDEGKEDYKAENDILYMFLKAPAGDNRTKNSNMWIEYKKGEIVELETFKKKFKAYAHFKHNINHYKWSNTSDNSTLENEGYIIKRLHICCSCNNKSQVGCCKNYDSKNRRRKYVIQNMVIKDVRVDDFEDTRITDTMRLTHLKQLIKNEDPETQTAI